MFPLGSNLRSLTVKDLWLLPHCLLEHFPDSVHILMFQMPTFIVFRIQVKSVTSFWSDGCEPSQDLKGNMMA